MKTLAAAMMTVCLASSAFGQSPAVRYMMMRRSQLQRQREAAPLTASGPGTICDATKIVNEQRKALGFREMTPRSDLQRQAERQAVEMSRADFMHHFPQSEKWLGRAEGLGMTTTLDKYGAHFHAGWHDTTKDIDGQPRWMNNVHKDFGAAVATNWRGHTFYALVLDRTHRPRVPAFNAPDNFHRVFTKDAPPEKPKEAIPQ